MDPVSHILLGLIVSWLMKLPWQGYALVLLGSVVPDVPSLLIFNYYGWKNITNDKNYREGNWPKKLFLLYDFFHSILFILIFFGISVLIPEFYYITIGLISHLLIDIPTHKWRGIAVFFPAKYLVRGFFNWIDVYQWFKKRIKWLP